MALSASGWPEPPLPPLHHATACKVGRAAREKDEKSAAEAAEKQRREAEIERIRREDKQQVEAGKEKKFGKGNLLQKPQMTAEERRAEDARGMTDEMRMRLEREKRARAAEERMRRVAQGMGGGR